MPLIVVYGIIVEDEDSAPLTVCATMRCECAQSVLAATPVAGVDNRRWAVRTIASLHSLPPLTPHLASNLSVATTLLAQRRDCPSVFRL